MVVVDMVAVDMVVVDMVVADMVVGMGVVAVDMGKVQGLRVGTAVEEDTQGQVGMGRQVEQPQAEHCASSVSAFLCLFLFRDVSEVRKLRQLRHRKIY